MMLLPYYVLSFYGVFMSNEELIAYKRYKYFSACYFIWLENPDNKPKHEVNNWWYIEELVKDRNRLANWFKRNKLPVPEYVPGSYPEK